MNNKINLNDPQWITDLTEDFPNATPLVGEGFPVDQIERYRGAGWYDENLNPIDGFDKHGRPQPTGDNLLWGMYPSPTYYDHLEFFNV